MCSFVRISSRPPQLIIKHLAGACKSPCWVELMARVHEVWQPSKLNRLFKAGQPHRQLQRLCLRGLKGFKSDIRRRQLTSRRGAGRKCCGRGWYHPVSCALCHLNQLCSHIHTCQYSNVIVYMLFFSFVLPDSGPCSIPSCWSWFYNHNISKSVSELNLLMPITFCNVTSVTFIKIISEIFLISWCE